MIEVTNYAGEGLRVLTGRRVIGEIEPIERQRPPKRGYHVVGSDTIHGTVTGAVVAVIMAHTRRTQ